MVTHLTWAMAVVTIQRWFWTKTAAPVSPIVI